MKWAFFRSNKPSDLVEATFGIENADGVDGVPGADIGKDVAAAGVEFAVKQPALVRLALGVAQDPPPILTASAKLARRITTLLFNPYAERKRR